ncbi:MAG: DUF177 domain-containing protein [Candidatus Eisenbacteria bacterium]|uniref:DUF177 domain-containing protein n=1 Tax=Eiseniibacteriota bacterium TaxID=2212470 RepID=A0A538TY55_UNCEI|nr:MAG: DUF177 domain-containing protein [Candidatus Eisenbacteria bacterium]
MSAFVIQLAALAGGLNRLEERALAADLELEESQWPGTIFGALTVERTGERVAVRGQVRAVAQLECGRCLVTFEQPVEGDLTLYADRSGGSLGLERELEDDHAMRFHDGRRLDLRGAAREALLVELPITPRCREECRGLCPTCGADLNQGPCDCGGRE